MKDLKILIACEFSGIVRQAFTDRGFNAISCDFLETEIPGKHYRGDVLEIISDKWDVLIAFPPCTDLAVSGATWFAEKRKNGSQQRSIDFFMNLAESPIKYIAIENPVGIMSKLFRKPDQYIQPWQFGDSVSKKTCLWLKNLPPLLHTKIVPGSKYITYESGRKSPEWHAKTGGGSGKKRSVFFPGIARAMADQWGDYLKNQYAEI